MRRIAVTLLSATSLFAFAHVASAADIAVKAPRVAVAGYDWSGFYIGGHAGHGSATSDWTFRNNSFFNNAAGETFSHDPKGGLYGAHIGYNFQSGSFVYGIEASWSGASINETSVSPFFPASDQLTTEVTRLWQVAARAGVAMDNWLFYAKAGFAGGRVEVNAFDTVSIVRANTSTTRSGYVVGLGSEVMLGSSWILGVEYNYIDLGSKRHSTTDSGGTLFTVDADVTVQTFVARLSYKFGGGPLIARY